MIQVDFKLKLSLPGVEQAKQDWCQLLAEILQFEDLNFANVSKNLFS